MHLCPQCGCNLELPYRDDTRSNCSQCGARLSRDSIPQWIDVARVNNLAEAGFLTEELIGREIEARIYELEEFSALTDRWASVYLIRVPAAEAQPAAAYIRQHLAEEAAEADSSAMGFRFSADQPAVDPLFWRPVALVVLAGVASFVLGQRFSDQAAERSSSRGSLTTAVGAIGRPLVTEPRAGQPRYRLSLDRQREMWYLDVDRDADGRYESRREIRASGAAW